MEKRKLLGTTITLFKVFLPQQNIQAQNYKYKIYTVLHFSRQISWTLISIYFRLTNISQKCILIVFHLYSCRFVLLAVITQNINNILKLDNFQHIHLNKLHGLFNWDGIRKSTAFTCFTVVVKKWRLPLQTAPCKYFDLTKELSSVIVAEIVWQYLPLWEGSSVSNVQHAISISSICNHSHSPLRYH